MPFQICSVCRRWSQGPCPEHSRRATPSPTKRRQDSEYFAERGRLIKAIPPEGVACHWGCGTVLTKETATADHVKPASEGGGSRGNLVLACKPCNSRRGAKLRSGRR